MRRGVDADAPASLRRGDQATILIGPDVADRGAGRKGQFVDAVFLGWCRAMFLGSRLARISADLSPSGFRPHESFAVVDGESYGRPAKPGTGSSGKRSRILRAIGRSRSGKRGWGNSFLRPRVLSPPTGARNADCCSLLSGFGEFHQLLRREVARIFFPVVLDQLGLFVGQVDDDVAA